VALRRTGLGKCSRTAIVLLVQFIAGTLVTFLVIVAFAVRRTMKRRRRQEVLPPAFGPEGRLHF
jgi:hypothetical protein